MSFNFKFQLTWEGEIAAAYTSGSDAGYHIRAEKALTVLQANLSFPIRYKNSKLK